MTVGDVIQGVIRKTGVKPLPEDKTCDRLMAGSLDREVHRIATTFMATVEVIGRALELKADMIVTHEPTWFTGGDDTEWLTGDAVYAAKKKLIDESGIAIWRFHDHMHMAGEDGIFRGINKELGWQAYRLPPPADIFGGHLDCCYRVPPTTLGELCRFFKKTLGMDVIRILGDPDQPIERVGILPGGGSLGLGSESMPMRLMARMNLDVIVCGEITEWTLPAYVRDAWQLGFAKSILILGHERSEEPGMKHLPDWMRSITGDIDVVFIDSREPFAYV